MVRVRVAGVALDASGQHVILLKPIDEPAGEGRILPIWIGSQEANSILVAVEGAQTPRPLAHDLMRTMLETLGATVDAVQITRIDDGTFYAEITLVALSGTTRIDARPSDAVALACRVGAGIDVADAVFDEAGIPDSVTGEEDGAGDSDAEMDAEERVDEFKRFLDDVDPDDFRET